MLVLQLTQGTRTGRAFQAHVSEKRDRMKNNELGISLERKFQSIQNTSQKNQHLESNGLTVSSNGFALEHCPQVYVF
jgi:hypothetical protein